MTFHDRRLAYDFVPGSGDTAVLLLHGFLSDRRAGGRFDRLASEYARLGHAVLRIDFSGFGESAGDVVDGDSLLQDASAALDHLDSLGYTRQILHGQSLGSAVALRIAPERPRVVTLVLTGALTGAGQGDRPYPFFSPEQTEAWYRDEDVHLPIEGSAARTHVVVNRQRPKLGATGTQEELLGAVKVPILVIHGDTGEQEQALAAITAAGRHLLPPGSEVVVIPGATHAFYESLDALAETTTAWVRKQV
ncbi:pimeloyl-ACP methyl ester carboxylesterase [Actinoplanes lutulentus]|uniref:Pimeloyl-ACP methyl ester carboxylesterase n=1 Tax=Actinoplanes lutulentus TaxID=1287878 RepID=A0A327ZP09_9ACTN|nr:alpha/beta fold hydrolase [Actinoplanes lutulentus]MBB2940814.1 pimeloyl-ACP methyl ester carboxylesterase [Actinoplanes lutulentus]RAK43124.1 pimeloyl-ACP methyl ester carboxylesterase [Actinoplanes lutulentus]